MTIDLTVREVCLTTSRLRRASTWSDDIQQSIASMSWAAAGRLFGRQIMSPREMSTSSSSSSVTDLHYRIDVNTLHRDESATQLGLNEIGRVRLRLTQPIFCDPYARNRTTGGLILIDESTNATVGAAVITEAS